MELLMFALVIIMVCLLGHYYWRELQYQCEVRRRLDAVRRGHWGRVR